MGNLYASSTSSLPEFDCRLGLVRLTIVARRLVTFARLMASLSAVIDCSIGAASRLPDSGVLIWRINGGGLRQVR